MKQSTKKKTQSKKSKVQHEPIVFNGALVGTWKNSDIIKITFDSGVMIVKYGNDEYKPSSKELTKTKNGSINIAKLFDIPKDKVVIVNV